MTPSGARAARSAAGNYAQQESPAQTSVFIGKIRHFVIFGRFFERFFAFLRCIVHYRSKMGSEMPFGGGLVSVFPDVRSTSGNMLNMFNAPYWSYWKLKKIDRELF